MCKKMYDIIRPRAGLTTKFESHEPAELKSGLLALRTVAEAHGALSVVAAEAGLGHESLLSQGQPLFVHPRSNDPHKAAHHSEYVLRFRFRIFFV